VAKALMDASQQTYTFTYIFAWEWDCGGGFFMVHIFIGHDLSLRALLSSGT